jgi:hypothetical protein
MRMLVALEAPKLSVYGSVYVSADVSLYNVYTVLFIKKLKDKDDFSCILLDALWSPSAALQGDE